MTTRNLAQLTGEETIGELAKDTFVGHAKLPGTDGPNLRGISASQFETIVMPALVEVGTTKTLAAAYKQLREDLKVSPRQDDWVVAQKIVDKGREASANNPLNSNQESFRSSLVAALGPQNVSLGENQAAVNAAIRNAANAGMRHIILGQLLQVETMGQFTRALNNFQNCFGRLRRVSQDLDGFEGEGGDEATEETGDLSSYAAEFAGDTAPVPQTAAAPDPDDDDETDETPDDDNGEGSGEEPFE